MENRVRIYENHFLESQKTSKLNYSMGGYLGIERKILIALNKLPGVQPVGIGESADRCFVKIMTI